MKIGYCEGTDEKALSASGSLSPPSSSSAILEEISPFPALLLLARSRLLALWQTDLACPAVIIGFQWGMLDREAAQASVH